jgi:bifunctional ADP-heptose synthase (sugar kinase/adenylyltransferase)
MTAGLGVVRKSVGRRKRPPQEDAVSANMTTTQILKKIRKIRALVVGDIRLDRVCRYDPELAEPSRETGIPRTAVISTEVAPGAGGAVARQALDLGAAEVGVLGVAGCDGAGYELEGALAARGVSPELLVRSHAPTFARARLVNCQTGQEDLPRIDMVTARPLPEETGRELISRLEETAPKYDVVIVSDQAETAEGGVVTPGMRDALSRLAQFRGGRTTFWVNSPKRAEHFRRVVVQVNRENAREACLRAFQEVNYFGLRHITRAPLLFITHGADGALIVHLRGLEWAFARSIENPVNTSGAGDAFSAGAALALHVSDDPRAAANFGNLAAEVAIMKEGTGTASPAEMLERESNAWFTRSVPSSPRISRW